MFALTLALLLAAPAAGPAPIQDPAAQPKPAVYDEKADAGAQISAAIAIAGTKNQRVLIQWGGNWCGWCIKLDQLCKSDQAIARKILYEYRVVHVDIGNVNKNLDLVKQYGATLDQGVPFLTVLDGSGKPVTQQETGALESGDHHDPALVLAFLEKHQAAPQDAGAVLAAAQAAAKTAGKRVLVAFEAPW